MMNPRTSRLPLRMLAIFMVASFVAAACGQKEGVHVAADGSGSVSQFETTGGGDGFTETTGDEGLDGETAAPAGQQGQRGQRQVTRTAGGGGTTGGGGGGGGVSPEGGGDGGGGGGAGSLQPQGSDRTGAGEDEIVLAIHAPVTGAAPLPADSFRRYGDLYWRYVTEIQKQPVLGRSKVRVEFRDDQYTPSTARQVCRQLMSFSFLLVGGGGTDQVQACGDLANSSNVPYLSAGVTERGLRGLPWYFATSMSYKQQADLLAQYIKANLPGKSAMIVTNTPNFDDAVQGWEEAVQRHGLDHYRVLKHSKGDRSWYNSFGNDLAQNDVKNVFVLTSPVDYIQFAQQNNDRGFQYVGVGITMGLNAILPTGCDDVHGGIFFSPFYGLDHARQAVPEFFEAGRTLVGGEGDDIALALWSLNSAIHEMFKRYEQTFGNDLTREDFRALLEQQQGIQTKVGPPLNYTPDDHFGAGQVHVLQADCTADPHVYRTLATFASGF